MVQGNYIGVNTAGTQALPNGGNGGVGIELASQTIIGGSRYGMDCNGLCNVISGNSGHGIGITGTTASRTVIQGNYIGVNIAGTYLYRTRGPASR